MGFPRLPPDPRGKTIAIVPAAPRHSSDWCRTRCLLWPEGSAATHRREIKSYFAGGSLDPVAVLIAEDGESAIPGFAELTLRSHAEGCTHGRIAYLEGWYVERTSRRKGVGRALLLAAEDWARANHCHEFASDAWSTNRLSRTAHLALGFEEAGVIRCFRKTLTRKGSGSRRPSVTPKPPHGAR